MGPEIGSEPAKRPAFGGRHSDSLRQFAAKDLILDFEVVDLPSQFAIRVRGEDEVQRLEQVGHRNRRGLPRGALILHPGTK